MAGVVVPTIAVSIGISLRPLVLGGELPSVERGILYVGLGAWGTACAQPSKTLHLCWNENPTRRLGEQVVHQTNAIAVMSLGVLLVPAFMGGSCGRRVM